MTSILNKFIPEAYHECPELEYFRCQVKESPSSHEFRLDPQTKKPKAGIYLRTNGEWRVGKDPYTIRGFFPLAALANAILFTATLLHRLIETTIVITGIFFRTYKATYRDCYKEGFSELVFSELETQISKQREGITRVFQNLVNDGDCFVSMQLAAGLGTFTGDQKRMVHMLMIWGVKEYQWNREKPYYESSIANFFRWIKYDCPKDITINTLIESVGEIVNRSNGSFYILECAQLRSENLVQCLKPLEDEGISTYAELAQIIKQKEAAAMQENPVDKV